MQSILLSPLSYQEINALCIVIMFGLVWYVRKVLKNINQNFSKLLFLLVVLYSVSLVCDAIRYTFDATSWPSIFAVTALAFVYNTSKTFAADLWFIYVLIHVFKKCNKKYVLYFVASIPSIILALYGIMRIFTASNVLNSSGAVQFSLVWFIVQNAVSIVYYVFAMIIAAIGVIKRREEKYNAIAMALLPAPYLIAYAMQIAFQKNYESFGMAVSFGVFICIHVMIQGQVQRKELVHFVNIMDSIKNQYATILYVNLNTDKVEPYIFNSKLTDVNERIFSIQGFDDSMKNYVTKRVYTSDTEFFTSNFSRKNIKKQLEENGRFSFEYRTAAAGEIIYMQVDCWQAKNDIDITHAVIGFKDISGEKQKQITENKNNSIIDGLVNGFEYVCYLDYANGEFEEYHASKTFEYYFNVIGVNSGIDRFVSIFKHGMSADEYKEFKERFSQDNILEALLENGTFTIDCRLNLGTGLKYYNIKAIGLPNNLEAVIYGIVDIDEQVRAEVEKEEHAKEREYSIQLETTIAERTAELHEKAKSLNQINEDITELLGNITEARDMESGEHIRRVKGFTRILANQIMKDYPEYGLDEEQIALITSASALHDIGKIMIPDSILRKPGKFTDEEFEVMKSHCEKGCEMLKMAPRGWDKRYLEFSMQICRYHHEKWDGNGYPDGLKGDDIPISAQIVSIADCFDALTTKRVYKDAFEPEEAVEMMVSGQCGQFSDKMISALKSVKKEFFAHMHDIGQVGVETARLKSSSVIDGVKILLVEDNALTREITTEILADEGAEVTAVSCGQEVLDCISGVKRIEYDAILLDLNLPDIDGFEVTRKIRMMDVERATEVPIIAVTSSTDKHDMQRAFNSGMNSYVPKPVSVANITRTLLSSMRSEQKNLKLKLDEAIMRANKDPLTGVKNMTAYTETVGEITTKISEHVELEFAIVICDVNKLKVVNDSFGHDMGDKYIQNCCKLICDNYSHSPVYRIGGDEFAVILTGNDYNKRNELIDELGDKIVKASKIDRIEDGKASMAVGMSVFNAYTDVSVASVAKRADESMYTNKRMMEFNGDY